MISSTGAHFPIAGNTNTSLQPAGTLPRRGTACSPNLDCLSVDRLPPISGLMMMHS